MFDKFIHELGSLDALINNASTIFPTSRLDDISEQRLEQVFRVNAIGNILCAKHAIKNMSKKYGHNGGKIINISSGASTSGSPNEYIDYACTKGAIDTLTVGLAKELADECYATSIMTTTSDRYTVHLSLNFLSDLSTSKIIFRCKILSIRLSI